jgi:hypothetical protein
MNRTEHNAKTPFAATGCFAPLRAFLHIQGSDAPLLTPLLALGTLLAALAIFAPSAQAEVAHRYLSQITGVPAGPGVSFAGPFANPRALALDAAGDVYVIDSAQGVVDEFSASGGFLSQFDLPNLFVSHKPSSEDGVSLAVNGAGSELYYGGGEGSEQGASRGTVYVLGSSGQLLGEWYGEDTPSGSFENTSVALDSSTSLSDPAAGDVYVADLSHGVVDVFRPEAGGKEKYLTQLTGEGTPPGEPFAPKKVAVDEANGNVLVVNQSVVDVFAPTLGGYEYVRQITGPPGGSFVRLSGVAEEGSGDGDIYIVEESSNEGAGTLYEFSPTGAYVTSIAGTPSSAFSAEPTGVAVTAGGDVYVTDAGTHHTLDLFGPKLVIPDVAVGAVSNLQPRGATLNGTVNPDAAGNATCHFEYGTSTAYGQSAACSEEVPSGPDPVEVHSEALNGLQPDTTYHFRLDASNANGSNTSEDGEFTTPGPGVLSVSVVDVASSSATLHAQIDPHGADTHYYFQYGTVDCAISPSACIQVPAGPGGDLGEGSGAQSVSAPLQDLQPSTVYHYRVVASNAVTTTERPDQTFKTQALDGPLTLPDGRQWELVSPAAKLGTQPSTLGLTQASEAGDAIVYPIAGPFVADAPGNVQISEALSKRGPDGWSTEDIATPHNGPAFINFYGQEYQFFSSDLSRGLVDTLGETPLSPQTSEKTPYVRDDATGVYTPLVNSANVPPGTKFGGQEEEPDTSGPQLVTATPDVSHVVLRSEVALTANASNVYYEWSASGLKPIPGGVGSLVVGKTTATDYYILRRVISTDGSRVFGGAPSEGNGRFQESHLFMTDMTNGQVLQLDRAQGVEEPRKPGAGYQIASSDGSLVLFSDSEPLTAGANGRTGLYAYDVETGKLTLTTVTVNSGEAPGVQGSVLGASEDDSYVYLVATGLLTEAPNAEGEKAVAGADNLYVLHREVQGSEEEWTPSFIGRLSPDDETEWSPTSVTRQNSGESSASESGETVEVSPNGRYLAFMSDRSLTGYDNVDVNEETGRHADEEVYLYDASAARLACASCNPSGARPQGYLEPPETLADPWRAWIGSWVAGQIPGPEAVTSHISSHEPRYVFNDGRLLFDSHDGLVPQDVNGVGDVYEYQSGGVGCATANNGCVALLSGGTGPRESALSDASANASDVFFQTADRLVSQDVGSDSDIYDAHVCSAEAACPASAVAPPPCTTADSCKGAISLQPGVFGAPASATFNGAGNPSPASPVTVKPKAKLLTRAQKLAKALRACTKKPKKKRPACERQARRAYGPAHKAKKTNRRRK